jgi:hypothetical protein
MIKSTQRGFILPLLVIVVAALAIGGGVYYSQQHPKAEAPEPVVSTDANVDTSTSFTTPPASSTDVATSTATSTPSVSTNANVSVAAQTSGTLGSLFALNKNVKCTFTSTGTGASSGTVYMAGTMMRGDFMLKGQTAGDAHMIRNGDQVYVWSGAQGAKMAMSALSGSQGKSQSGLDLNQQVSYQCENWVKEDSRFVAPTTVNFVDIAAMINSQAGLSLPR